MLLTENVHVRFLEISHYLKQIFALSAKWVTEKVSLDFWNPISISVRVGHRFYFKKKVEFSYTHFWSESQLVNALMLTLKFHNTLLTTGT